MTTDDYESWRVALARVEGKIDTMVELATRMQVTVTALDSRVRDLETSMARVKQQLTEIERSKVSRVPWTAATAAVAGIVAVALVIAERLFK